MRILAFFGTPSRHLCIFGFFGTLGNTRKDTLRSRLGFLAIIADFVAHGYYLACLVPPLWRPGEAWDDPGTILGRSWDIGGRKEGPCEVQARILSI